MLSELTRLNSRDSAPLHLLFADIPDIWISGPLGYIDLDTYSKSSYRIDMDHIRINPDIGLDPDNFCVHCASLCIAR